MDTPYEKLLEKLAAAEVRFILVGGLAVALNGFVRTTQDVDILVESSEKNLHRLLDSLASFGEGYARELSIADFDGEEGAVRLIEDFPLDIFTVMRGRRYEELKAFSRETEICGLKINYLGAEGLIALKEDSSREKDRIDTSALKSILRQTNKL